MKFARQIQVTYLLSILFALSLLTGCATVTPNRLGISKAEWDQYSPAKQEQLLSAYEAAQARKKEIRAQPGSGVLSVKISDGKMLFPPYTDLTKYEPISFTLQQGDCHRKIPVFQLNEEGKAKLEVCYQGDTLYLDPSPYQSDLSLGSLRFLYMPVWKRGFTYSNVTSAGLLKLNNVQIRIRELVPRNE